MKNHFRKSAKFILPVLVGIFLFCSTTYFTSCYINKHSITFDAKDNLIFFLFFGCVAIGAALIIMLVIRVSRLENVVRELMENVVDSEDNLVEMHRTTQRIVMRLCNKLGEGSDEKKE